MKRTHRGLALALTALALLPPARAAADPLPRISVTLDDGRDRARPGDHLTWTVTVHNLGHTRLDGLRVTQQLPAASAPVPSLSGDAAPAATVTDGTAVWDGVALEPDATRTLRISAALGDDASAPARSASTACVHTTGAAAPLACATDLDLLAAAPPAGTWSVPAVAAAVGGLGLAAFVLVLRRRRAALRLAENP
ncbi:hypothetical protein [Kitasatospora albolonga]|uniref:hypothetical protein n=1 Tax=Kitasatospora albolonga TaxID=68173 RepID=UPI0035EC088C